MGHMIEVREYLDAEGNSPYAKWFDRLNVVAAVKVTTAAHRMEQGNFSNVKGVGAGVYEYRIDFGPGYRLYFGKDGGSVGDIARGWYQEAPRRGYCCCKRALARLQASETARGDMMALTKDFKDTIQARAQRDPAFRKALLQEGVECLLAGDVDTGKAVLRDYINATIGFEELSQVFDKSSKSLMRMFGPKGNPQASNLFAVIQYLQEQEGIHLEVKARKVA
jgi:putative addiction module killer protein